MAYYGTGTFLRTSALSTLNTIMTSGGGTSGWSLFDGATSGSYVVWRDPVALRPAGRDPIYLVAKTETENIGLAKKYKLYFELYEEWSASSHEAVANTAWCAPTTYSNANYILQLDDIPRGMTYWFSVDSDRVIFAIEGSKGYQGTYAGALSALNSGDVAPFALNYFHIDDSIWIAKNFDNVDNSAKSGYKYEAWHINQIDSANRCNGGVPGNATNAVFELAPVWAINKTFGERRGSFKACYVPPKGVTSEDVIQANDSKNYICFNGGKDAFRIAIPTS